MSALADQYEKRFPETGIPEAQKEERMERMLFKDDRRSLRRTMRSNGIVVPRLPWVKDEDE